VNQPEAGDPRPTASPRDSESGREPQVAGRKPAIDILFEDADLMAVAKPSGLVAHPCYKHPDGTLFDALVSYLHDTDVHPRLLQRLDKGTSGVMLVSKTMKAHAGVIRAMGRRGAGGLRKE